MTYYSIILFAKVSPIIQNIFTYYSNNFTDYSSNLHLILTFNSIIVYVLSIRKGIRKISESHMIIFALTGELNLHLILTFNSIIVYVLSIRKGIRKISESHMIIFALTGELRVCRSP